MRENSRNSTALWKLPPIPPQQATSRSHLQARKKSLATGFVLPSSPAASSPTNCALLSQMKRRKLILVSQWSRKLFRHPKRGNTSTRSAGPLFVNPSHPRIPVRAHFSLELFRNDRTGKKFSTSMEDITTYSARSHHEWADIKIIFRSENFHFLLHKFLTEASERKQLEVRS